MRTVLRQRRVLLGLRHMSPQFTPQFVFVWVLFALEACLPFRGWVVGFGGGGCPSVLSRSSVPCLAGGLLRRYLLYERRFVIHKRELPQTILMMVMMVMMLMAVTVKSAPHTLRPVFLGPVRGNSARCSDRFLSETVPPSLSNCVFWEKFSGANFCFCAFGSGPVAVFWCCFAYVFLLYYVALFSRKPLEKFSSCQARVLGEIFGSELLFFSLCVRLVFFGVVLPMFLLYYVALFSRKPLEKFSSCQVRFLGEIFGSEFLFLAFVSGWCFLVLFCLCFCFIMWHCSPESRIKNSLLVRCAFWKKFSGANFCFLPLCPVGVFWWSFAYVFSSLCGLVLPKVARKNSLLVRYTFWKNFWGASLFFSTCVRLVFFWCCFARFTGASPWAW